MNIEKYTKKTRFKMPLGSLILREDMRIVSADQYIYKYLDKRYDKLFTELIHPDNRQEFLDAVANVDKADQYLVVPVITTENEYRCMLLKLKRDKHQVDGFRCLEVSVADIIAAMDKHVVNRVNLMKYRRTLSLADYIFFDYEKRTNKLNIYMYANDKSYMFWADDIDVWVKQMKDNHLWSDVDKKKFETLCIYVKDGLDDFKMQLYTTFFSKGGRSDSIVISGSTMFDVDGSRIVSGTIKLDAQIKEKPYYTTEASKDSATGLMNKRAIMEYAASRITGDEDRRLALFVIDIDDFKNINDAYGHLFGDAVIFRVAETIKRIVGASGTVARFGGDEFVVLLENCDDESMNYILKNISDEIGILFTDEKTDLHITTSIGVSNYPNDGATYEELFKKADKALYIAKDNGKNNCVVYDETVHRDVEIISDTKRMKGLKSIASRVNRSALYSEIILMLSKRGAEAIPQAISKICDLYDVAGMSVFAGDDLACIFSVGQYRNPVVQYTLLKKRDYMELISEDDMVCMEDVRKYSDKTFFENYSRLEINANLTSIYRVEGKVKAVVTFDTFNTSRHWSDSDMISLNALGKLIGQKVSED